MRPEAVTSSRIEPETIWLAALCLNQLRHRVLQLNVISDQDHNTEHRLKDNNPHHGCHVLIKMGLPVKLCRHASICTSNSDWLYNGVNTSRFGINL